VRVLLLGCAVLVGMLAGCGSAEKSSTLGESCSSSSDCKGKLRCVEQRCRDLVAEEKAEEEKRKLRQNESCSKTWRCSNFGRCSYQASIDNEEGARCIATKPAHCRESGLCRGTGHCTLRNGACVLSVGSDADCAKDYGKEKFNSCAQADRCSERDGICVLTNEQCRSRKGCSETGHCTARNPGPESFGGIGADGVRIIERSTCVVASDDDCARTERCKELGACSRSQSKSGVACVVGSEEGCLGSRRCKEFGKCAYRGSDCVAVEDSACASSMRCASMGACSALNGDCVAKTDADCRRSKLCQTENRCFASAGSCVRKLEK